MPEPIKYATVATLGDTNFVRRADSNGTVLERVSPTVPAATGGTVATRTDADTATVTLANGHGLTSGAGDVFWAGGSRHGMTFTVSSNTLTVDGGAGDSLPLVGVAVAVMKPVSVAFTVTGDNVTGIGAKCAAAAYVAPFDNAGTPAEITSWAVGPDAAYVWRSGVGVTNPLAGKTTTVVKLTHGALAPQVVTVVAVTGTDG